MPRRPQRWDYDRELLGRGLGQWIRHLDRLRRAQGRPRGLSQNDFARDAGIGPAKLSYVLAGAGGRGLDRDERVRLLAALERQILWTANDVDCPLIRSELTHSIRGHHLAPVLTQAGTLPSLDALRTLANLPAVQTPDNAANVWAPLLALGDQARARCQWNAALTTYSKAAALASAGGARPAAALALAHEAVCLLELHDHNQAMTTVDAALAQLGALALRPTTAPAPQQLAACLSSDEALTAYSVLARTCAYRWHVVGKFSLARQAAQAGVNAGILRHGASYDEALADSYHFLAKALIEEVAAETTITRLPGPVWRLPSFQPGWRWTIHQAQCALANERKVRPPDDAAGFGHSWRNTGRALRLLLAGTTDGAQRRQLARQVTEAQRQASRYTHAAAANGPDDHLIALYLDQARWALESRQEKKRIMTPLRQGIELAVERGALRHASWGWCIEAQVLIDTRRRGWETESRRALFASLASWPDPFESRDSAKTIQLVHHHAQDLGLDQPARHRLCDAFPNVIDQVAGGNLPTIAHRLDRRLARLELSGPRSRGRNLGHPPTESRPAPVEAGP